MQTGGRVHNNDFKHLWLGSRILAKGGDPYDRDVLLMGTRQAGFETINPFVYLPATGLLIRPFTFLPFSASAHYWFWMNWTLAWVCALGGPNWLKVEGRWLARLAAVAYLIGAMPFYRQMTAGQMNVVVLAALVLALGLLIRGWDCRAGVVLGIAAAFKIAPLFLLLILAGLRRWKAAGVGIITFVLLCVGADLWTGWEAHGAAWSTLRAMGYGRSVWEEFGNDFFRDPFNQSFNSLFHHLFTENPHTAPWMNLGPGAANALTLTASILLLVVMLLGLSAGWKARPKWREAQSTVFLEGTLLMLLLPSLMWDHYAVQALAAVMWIFGSRRMISQPALFISALLIFFLLAWPINHGAESWRHGWGIPIMSLRLWGILGLLVVLFQGRERSITETEPRP